MTIQEAMKQLRDDIKAWCTANFLNMQTKIDSISGGSGSGASNVKRLILGTTYSNSQLVEAAKMGYSLIVNPTAYAGTMNSIGTWTLEEDPCGDGFAILKCYAKDECGDDECMFNVEISGEDATVIRQCWNNSSSSSTSNASAVKILSATGGNTREQLFEGAKAGYSILIFSSYGIMRTSIGTWTLEEDPCGDLFGTLKCYAKGECGDNECMFNVEISGEEVSTIKQCWK